MRDTPIAPGAGPRRRLLVGLSLAAVYVIWGSTYLALRVVVEGLPPLLASGARYLCAGTVLFAFLRLRGAPTPTPREWANALPVGVLLFFFGNGMVSLAERDVASSMAALLCATTPLFAAGLGRLAGERTSTREWAGLSLGFAGVVVMSLGDLRATPGAAVQLLLASSGWALGSMLARRRPLPRGLMSAAAQMLTGGAAVLVAGLVRGEVWPARFPQDAVLAFAYLVVFGSLVAFSAYSYLLRATTPAVALSYAYVNPIVAVVLGVVLGAEALAPSTLAAGGLVLAGVVVLVARRPAPRA